MEFAENLALDVFVDLALVVAPGLQPVEQMGVRGAEEDDEVEPALGEKVAGVKLEDDAALLRHHGLERVTHHVFIKLRHVERLIPVFVEVSLPDQLRQLDIGKPFQIVILGKLRLKQGAKRRFPHAWSPRDEDVRQKR